MKFSAKTLLIVVGAVLGLVVLAAGAFVAFFPKDAAIAEAGRRVEAATGRNLDIAGDVNLSFWPALGFSAEQASLSNPEGFSEAPFLAADRIVFAVAVLPLLQGRVEVKQLILEGADINLEAKPDGAANWAFPTEEGADQPSIEDLQLDDVRMTAGRISFDGGDGQPPLALENVNAALALQSLDAPATLQGEFDYRGERLSVDANIAAPRAILEQGETPIQARLDSGPLEASLDGVFNAATGALNGQLDAGGESLRRLMAWIGSPMAEGGGFGAFRLQAAMAHEGVRTTLSESIIRLDAIEARGDLALIAAPGAKLRVTGALNAPQLDLTPYLPAPAQAAADSGVEVGTPWSNDPIDLSGLRAVDADLQIAVGALKFQRLSFSDVAMALRIANGAADARLTQASLYGGAGTARMIADGAGATPRIAVELDARNVDALPLLTDAIGFDKIEGRGRLTASLAGEGLSQAAIMRSLRGPVSFQFNDGAWRGVNLAQVARVVQSALTGAETSSAAATDFAELAANFQISGGVAATENLRLLNPFIRLDGQGLIDIGGQSLDMRLAPRAVRSIEGQGGATDVQGLGVPFRVSGPWARPSFRPALGDALQNELRERARAVLADQEAGSPLASLGEAIFGRQAVAPAEETPPADDAAPPAAEQPQQQEEERTPEDAAREALGRLFKRD